MTDSASNTTPSADGVFRPSALPGEIPVFFIIIPTLNSESTIDDTILSIVSQTGPLRVHIHVQDGGSTDGTLAKVRHWQDLLVSHESCLVRCRGVELSFAVEKDDGVYDAIRRGTEEVEMEGHDLMTWLGSDDLLLPGALATLTACAKLFPKAKWFTGVTFLVESSVEHISSWSAVPHSTQLIRDGLCDMVHAPLIQQEGTFWRRSLWDQVGGLDTKLKLAGDYDLWRRFANVTELFVVLSRLAAFRRRPNQLSACSDKYLQEICQMIPAKDRADAWAKWRAHARSGQMITSTQIHLTGKGYRKRSINAAPYYFPVAAAENQTAGPALNGIAIPALTLKRKLRALLEAREVRKSGLFFESYYLSENPEVQESGMDPVLHYILLGAYRGCDPNPLFDSTYYLDNYKDVADSGMNPLYHYILYGVDLDCNPSADFCTREYRDSHPDVCESGENPLHHFLFKELLKVPTGSSRRRR